MQLKQYDEAILVLNSVIQLAPSKKNYQELKRIAIKNKSNILLYIGLAIFFVRILCFK